MSPATKQPALSNTSGTLRGPTIRRIQFHVDRALPPVAICAVLSLALEFGFYAPPLPFRILVGVQLCAAALYALSRLLRVAADASRWRAVARLWYDGVVLIVATIAVTVEHEYSHAPAVTLSAVYVATLQVALGVRLTIKAVQLNLLLSQRVLQPTRMILFAFVSLILLGTLALALPRATPADHFQESDFSLPHHVLNCAFTATSATCVTGLIVRDTGTEFTRFGQLVILLLIQLGGLGIMVFGSVLGLLAGRSLSLRESLVLQDETSHQTLGEVRGLVVFIVASTLIVEAVGAVMLYPLFADVPQVWERIFHAVFHSVSAFCNAGFALRPDSLAAYRQAWPTYLVIMPLIVVGGLGFPVLLDLWQGAKRAFVSHLRRDPGVRGGDSARRRVLSLHSRLVLVASALLIAGPAMMFMVFESQAVGVGDAAVNVSHVGEATPGARLLDAAFLSITCRTAGFNTVSMDTDSLTPASHMLAAILMFIGGSPGSTAGGVKTSSLAVMALGVWATLRGRRHVEVNSRRIPEFIVRRAGVVMVVMAALISTVTLLLCVTERVPLREALFETVSAAGTVGLSTGLTSELTDVGRFVIMLTMLAGRIGPLTVLIAMAGTSKPLRYEYPEEAVVIG